MLTQDLTHENKWDETRLTLFQLLYLLCYNKQNILKKGCSMCLKVASHLLSTVENYIKNMQRTRNEIYR